MSNPADISVIIPVRNAAVTLNKTVQSLLKQTNGIAEIIIVDDGSDMPVREFDECNYPIRIQRFPENRGPAAARNHGAGMALGKILLFLDADVLLESGAIDRVFEDFATNPDIAAVQGIYTPDLPRDRGLYSRYQNHYYHYSFKSIPTDHVAVCATFCFAIKRDIFETIGGFEPAIKKPTVEDEAFGYKLNVSGYSILLDRDIQVMHLAEYSAVSLIRRKFTMSFHQIKSFLHGNRLPLSDREGLNRTHHAFDTLAAIILSPSIIFSMFVGWQAFVISMLLYLSANARFWRYLLKVESPVHAFEMIWISWLDQLAIFTGLLCGSVDYYIKRTY
ncbi:glycosyltransferase family 2 protein [bacterium]|nr:glycosyltransferase family 2 protein [candidate division CSSED10-310 bacterium]